MTIIQLKITRKLKPVTHNMQQNKALANPDMLSGFYIATAFSRGTKREALNLPPLNLPLKVEKIINDQNSDKNNLELETWNLQHTTIIKHWHPEPYKYKNNFVP